MLETTLKNLKVFGKLCGSDASKSVIFATTKWEDVKKNVGVRREGELFEKFWKEMLDEGSRTARIENTPESVWSTINMVLEKQPVHAERSRESQARRSGDPEYEETLRQLQSVLGQAQRPRIPLGSRLTALFPRRKRRVVSSLLCLLNRLWLID
jgi:hypothetical protein